MSPFLVATDLVVRNPCRFIEEGSWQWWIGGCWMFRVETWIVFTTCALMALLLARLVRMFSQEQHA